MQPQRDVAQSEEVSSKPLGATDHGASPKRRMRTISGKVQIRCAESVSLIIWHRVNRVTFREDGHCGYWCSGESGFDPHDQMKVFHQLKVTTTSESQLHSQQTLQLGAVPFSSVGDFRARHGRDSDAMFQFGGAQAGRDAFDALERALDHLQATLGQLVRLICSVSVHEGFVGTHCRFCIKRHKLRPLFTQAKIRRLDRRLAVQRGIRSKHCRRRHAALRTDWLSSNTTLYWHMR